MNPIGGEGLKAVTYFKTNFIATGFGSTIRTSRNGEYWRTIPSLGKQGFTAVAASDDLVVALGSSEAWRSEDGMNWKMAPVPYFSGPFGFAYGSGTFVGVGQNGAVVFSRDGVRWDITTAPGGPYLVGVAFGAGKFVAVGPDAVETSSNGKVWTPVVLNFKMQMYAVAYGRAGFVAVGQSGLVAQSLDGESWQTNSFPTTSLQFMQAITFDDKYIAVGVDTLDFGHSGSSVFSSTDGLNWQAEPSHATVALSGVASGGGHAVAVGDGGTIVRSNGNGWVEQSRRVLPVSSLTCTVGKGFSSPL